MEGVEAEQEGHIQGIKFKTQIILAVIYATLIDTSWRDAVSDTAQSVARRVTQCRTVTTQELEGKCFRLQQDML